MKKRIAVLASLVYLTCLVQSTISGAIEIMQISRLSHCDSGICSTLQK